MFYMFSDQNGIKSQINDRRKIEKSTKMKKLNNTLLKTNGSEESKAKLKYTLRWTETETQNAKTVFRGNL